MASHDRFGYEWDKYDYLLPFYEEQFLNWLGPFDKDVFVDKNVLDAGCGMGRNTFYAAKWGARNAVGFDYDMQSVNAARRTLKDVPNAAARYESIYDITYRDVFDLVFSVGVIHHLADPKKALANLFAATKPGGKLVIWVYGYDNNEWVVRYINPIRKITSKLPVKLLHILCYFFSVPLYLFLKIFPHRNKYMQLMSRTNFNHIHLTVFDQLVPEVANYWRRDEVEELVESLPENKTHAIYPYILPMSDVVDPLVRSFFGQSLLVVLKNEQHHDH